jgi:hypothetical protein
LFEAKPGKQSPPDLSPQQTAFFTQAVAEYIRAQRDHYYSRAAPLSFSELWSRFFRSIDLQRIRALQARPPLSAASVRGGVEERVPNPPFYSHLEKLGFTGLPNFTAMAAIAFDDVVVFHDPLTPQLIFHEMVHVVQYRLLGVDEFARLYVRGYLHGGYEETPLEVCAYQLDGRFLMGSGGFDVESEVRSWIDSGRF